MNHPLQIIASNKFKKPLFSKWQKIQVLLDPIEMENLLQHLSPLVILNVSQVVSFNNISIAVDKFICGYKNYINILRGSIPKEKIFLSYAFTQNINNFRAIMVGTDKYICRAIQPDIHIQAYFFLLGENGKILPQTFSEEAISWGIQISYPAIFQDAYTMEAVWTTGKSFHSWNVFSSIRHWIRNHTLPIPIFVQKKIRYLPIRLGKKATNWLATHIDRDKIISMKIPITKILKE